MLATVLEVPLPATTTRSPRRTRPLATVPEKPRKSEFGRLTHCTGKRNGFKDASGPVSIVSSTCNSVGPRYQGVARLAAVTLSPKRADMGIAVNDLNDRPDANLTKSATISSKTPWSNSTRSILLTASTTCATPSSEQIVA